MTDAESATEVSRDGDRSGSAAGAALDPAADTTGRTSAPRALAGLALAVLLAGGAWSLAGHGPWATGRVAVAQGAKGPFGEAWGGGALGAQLNQLDRLLDDLRAEDHAVVLLQRRQGVNPLIGLATHRLFPTLVVPAWPKEVPDLAAETGATVVLRFEDGAGWARAEVTP